VLIYGNKAFVLPSIRSIQQRKLNKYNGTFNSINAIKVIETDVFLKFWFFRLKYLESVKTKISGISKTIGVFTKNPVLYFKIPSVKMDIRKGANSTLITVRVNKVRIGCFLIGFIKFLLTSPHTGSFAPPLHTNPGVYDE
jgi:hypothetical protein